MTQGYAEWVSTLIAFALSVLAAARLTRLISADDITAPARIALANRIGAGSFWFRLILCRWCLGLWVAAPVITAGCVSHGKMWFALPAGILAASHLIGLMAEREKPKP